VFRDGNLGIGYPRDGHGYGFLPVCGHVPDPNLGGYGHEYFFPPTGNPSGTRNEYIFSLAQ
jgi:hypothetical protein